MIHGRCSEVELVTALVEALMLDDVDRTFGCAGPPHLSTRQHAPLFASCLPFPGMLHAGFLSAYDAACVGGTIKPSRVEAIKDVVRDLVRPL
jgi:hypothetical protein